jgi:glucosamine--fructose-6-phosphate aminotransferase (isomerizing)
MKVTPYIKDILEQPAALKRAVEAVSRMEKIFKHFPDIREFDNIIFTGMGASLNALYPSYLDVGSAGLPALWISTAELLFDQPGRISNNSLIIMASQSGRSAETLGLLEHLKRKNINPRLIGITNDQASPLAIEARYLIELQAGEENTVSTKTYMNTLYLAGYLAIRLQGKKSSTWIEEGAKAAELMEDYLQTWETRVDELKSIVGLPRVLYFVGRGSSLATALNGALITKEASKYAPHGSSAADFRHGPFELIDGNLTTLIFAGHGEALILNRRMAEDILSYGGHSFLVSGERQDRVPVIGIPRGSVSMIPLFEIALVQLLTLALSELNGHVPGEFRHSGKITSVL